jgi:hypothetical protein
MTNHPFDRLAEEAVVTGRCPGGGAGFAEAIIRIVTWMLSRLHQLLFRGSEDSDCSLPLLP